MIDDLSIKREHLRKYVDAHRVLLLPVRRLPAEILQEIFIHCLPTEHNAVRSVTEPPLLLGRICRAWRTIALWTPQLWSSVHIVIPNHVTPTMAEKVGMLDRRYELLKFWLARSGMCPLSISLVIAEFGSTNCAAAALWMEALIPFSYRWKSIELKVPWNALAPLENLSIDDIPWLERLTVNERICYKNRSNWQDMSILHTSPRLHSISLLNFQTHSRSLRLPWDRLTQLSIDTSSQDYCPNVNEALEMLRQCPNLQSCSLMITQMHEFIPPLEPVTLLVLDSINLYLILDRHIDVTPLFENLFAPRLREMEIAERYDWANDFLFPHSHAPFIPLLSRPSCQLKALSVRHLFISEAALIECLQLAPSLTQLCIEDWTRGTSQDEPFLWDQVLQVLILAQGSSEGCLSPNLECVKFSRCSACSEEVLLSFIESRWHSVPSGIARLRSADVEFTREAQADIMPQIRLLCEEGLRLKVVYPTAWHISPWEGLPEE